MLLTHLVESDSQYRSWASKLADYKILDNSLVELGGAVDISRLLNAAEEVMAQEIVLPDVFRDGAGTLYEVTKAIKEIKDRKLLGQYKLQAVCHGNSFTEFAQTFEALNALPEVDVIGIPKVCAKMHPAGRPAFEALWQYSTKDIHLLGLWYTWSEVFMYKNWDRIRSMDTCLAAFQVKYHLEPTAVRPDGFSIDMRDSSLNTNKLLDQISWVSKYILNERSI